MASTALLTRSALTLCMTALMLPAALSPLRAGGKAFSRFGVEEGLSQGSVYCIYQDSFGFLWIGTRDGLNRFDGYQFKIYQSKQRHSPNMPDSGVKDLLESPRGRLLIATTGGGLAMLDLIHNRIQVLRHNPNDPATPSSNHITHLSAAEDGKVWLGGQGGLDLFDGHTNRVQRINLPFGEGSGDRAVTALAPSPSGGLYLGTKKQGLWHYQPHTKHFEHLSPAFGLPHGGIDSLMLDDHQRLWIGTREHGLFREVDEQFVAVNLGPDHPKRIMSMVQMEPHLFWFGSERQGLFAFDTREAISRPKNHRLSREVHTAGNIIMALYVDHSGLLWIGSDGDGLFRYNRQNERFNHRLPGALVRAFSEAPDGSLWVGSYGQGLFHLDRNGETLEHLQLGKGEERFLSNKAMAVMHRQNGELWVGSDGGGIFFRRPGETAFQNIRTDPSDPNSLSGNNVWSILEDRKGRMWVGTEFNGLNVMDPAAPGRFRQYLPGDAADAISDSEVWTIYEDRSGRLWVGTESGGLNRLKEDESGFIHFSHEPGNPHSIASENIKTITEDSQGRLWVGTTNGLNLFLGDEAGFRVYDQRNGFPNNVVYAVLEDAEGYLWLSTNQGLVKFTPENGTLATYTTKDGLQGNEFNTGAYLTLRDGRLAFGGVNGINLFSPNNITFDPMPPEVIMTDLLIFNQSTANKPPPTPEDQSQPALFAAQEIQLNADDDMVTLEFAALHFANPQQNQYRYILEGLDEQWVETDGTNRRATYTFLPPGRFQFKVIAANHDGVWNPRPTVLTLHVLPAWWQTTWAYLLYLALLLAAVGGYVWRQKKIQTMLADKVASATADLNSSHAELRAIDCMVRGINSVQSMAEFTQILASVLPFRERFQRARLLTRHPSEAYYVFQGVVGWDQEKLAPIRVTIDEINNDFAPKLKQLDHNVFLWRHDFDNLGSDTLFGVAVPRAILILRVRINRDTWGFLSFENMDDDNAFNDIDLAFLPLFQEHLFSALSRLHLLESLQTLNTRKNEFLGIAAHDLRSPINGLTLTTQYMREMAELDQLTKEEQLELLTKFEKTTVEMERLLKELLNISAIESGTVRLEIQPVQLTEILTEVLARYHQAAVRKDIDIAVMAPKGGAGVEADPPRVAEILDNLISNAVKYTHPGGLIRIFFESRDGFLITHIQDSGQGMTEQDIAQAFRAFSKLSARPTGGESSTGLGLAIVKKLVGVHGGEVWVQSKQGEGSCFSFSLPYVFKDQPNSSNVVIQSVIHG